MHTNTLGWDIGGAHLKAALISPTGEITALLQQPCPLWKGLAQLQQAVGSIMQALDPTATYRHAITMTGELVDLFTDRTDGVRQIIRTMVSLLPGQPLLVYAGPSGFLPAQAINGQHYDAIASANWLASASLAAQHVKDGLFVDIGSTTTDILLLQQSQVRAQGHTDFQRLISQELIYTGIVRTAVMAVTRHAEFENQAIGLMAEYFATLADVYRVTGELDEQHDQTETADGGEKTIPASARRLARMIGCDFNETQLPLWQRFAANIRKQQLLQIQSACQKHLYRNQHTGQLSFIGAGIGRFLVQEIALNLGVAYVDFSSLLPPVAAGSGLHAADCAPAVAVALLANRHPLFSGL